MLLPRPEIRIATRFGSAMMALGPVPVRSPTSRGAADGAAPAPGFDPADLDHGLARAFEVPGDFVLEFGAGDHRHSDAAVEGPRHFAGLDAAALLEDRKNG